MLELQQIRVQQVQLAFKVRLEQLAGLVQLALLDSVRRVQLA